MTHTPKICELRLHEESIPWSGKPAFTTGEITRTIELALPVWAREYVPSSISLYTSPGISTSNCQEILGCMLSALKGDIARRLERKSQFIHFGALSDKEYESLVSPKHVQPWIVCESLEGGLSWFFPAESADGGVIPCTSMQNHGVAWKPLNDSLVATWLVTSRRFANSWDWDSDVGHESCHAAFAPVPLFLQSFGEDPLLVDFGTITDPGDLSTSQLARILYCWCEIATVAVRGEPRPTGTGLPVVESAAELGSLIRLSDLIFPGCGFDRALASVDRVGGTVAVEEGRTIYEIGAPALRTMQVIERLVNSQSAPSLSQIRQCWAGINRQ